MTITGTLRYRVSEGRLAATFWLVAAVPVLTIACVLVLLDMTWSAMREEFRVAAGQKKK